LFNHGYYWEAHESWEAVWIAAGRQGRLADFVKGLIRLAAAGLKGREGRVGGVTRHAQRAKELFEAVRAAWPPDSPDFMGLNLRTLIAAARRLAEDPERIIDESDRPVVVVMPFQLTLASPSAQPTSATSRPFPRPP
jgi:hypothetical protein